MPPPEAIARFVAAVIVGYLLGSTPSGVVVGHVFGNVDPRAHGSGKTGATNVLRTLGPGPAALVVLMDAGKGVLAVLLARFVFMPTGAGASLDMRAWAEALAAFAAILGHNYSIFIHFTGGRGVATGGGAILAINPITFVFSLVAMVIPIALTRFVSLGSMLGAATAAVSDVVLVLAGRDQAPHAVFMIAGATFIILAHRDNIQRLATGTERKLGQPRSV